MRQAASALALALLGGCTDGAGRYTSRQLQVESRTEGDLEFGFAWLDPDTLLTVAPFHASAQRNAFTQARLDELCGVRPGARLYLALALYRFDPSAGPLSLGSDGIAL